MDTVNNISCAQRHVGDTMGVVGLGAIGREVARRAAAFGMLDVGGDQRTWCGNMRFFLAKGPRADGSGRVAEDVRQLKARYAALLVTVTAG